MTARLDPSRFLTADELDPAPSSHRRRWTALTAIEVALATAAVLLDVIVPSLVLLAMAGVSLLIRRRGFGSLGFHRIRDGGGLVLKMLAFAAAWSLFQLAVTMPIANHVSGRTTDLSDFEGLEGNLGMLAGLLALSWTVAALGEELAYRGYLQTRVRELGGSTSASLVLAVVVSSVLFGVAHSEQGVVGGLTITLDAVAFSILRYRYRTLWASVLAHGFNNTIGFVAFYFVGPVHGLW